MLLSASSVSAASGGSSGGGALIIQVEATEVVDTSAGSVVAVQNVNAVIPKVKIALNMQQHGIAESYRYAYAEAKIESDTYYSTVGLI